MPPHAAARRPGPLPNDARARGRGQPAPRLRCTGVTAILRWRFLPAIQTDAPPGAVGTDWLDKAERRIARAGARRRAPSGPTGLYPPTRVSRNARRRVRRTPVRRPREMDTGVALRREAARLCRAALRESRKRPRGPVPGRCFRGRPRTPGLPAAAGRRPTKTGMPAMRGHAQGTTTRASRQQPPAPFADERIASIVADDRRDTPDVSAPWWCAPSAAFNRTGPT